MMSDDLMSGEARLALWRQYATAYGYSVDAWGLATLQMLTGLYPSGIPDDPTIAFLLTPRCGCRDDVKFTPLFARDAVGADRQVRFHIQAYVGGIQQADQRELIHNAWEYWAEVADFTYREVNHYGEHNVLVSTGRGRRAQFDGPGGVLAWAELNQAAPDQSQVRIVRYDLDEDWNPDLFRAVSDHEYGHILGLDHSTYKSALMFPYANLRIYKPQPQDDIPRIRGIYGAAKQLPPSGPKPKTPEPKPKPQPPNGGSMFDELIRKLVGMAVDALIATAEAMAAKTATKADDFLVGLAKPKRDWLVDLIASRIAGLGRLPTPAELQAIATDCVEGLTA